MDKDGTVPATPTPQPDDAWLDEALEQSFPASDPLPTGHKSKSKSNDL